jgi:hypothetical protein
MKDELDFERAKSKLNIEVIDLRNIVSIYASFEGEFIRKS